MKKMIIVCSMLAYTCFAKAQMPGVNELSEAKNENSVVSAVSRPANAFLKTEIIVKDGLVKVQSLPEVKHSIFAFITNSAGDILSSGKLTAINNAIDVIPNR